MKKIDTFFINLHITLSNIKIFSYMIYHLKADKYFRLSTGCIALIIAFKVKFKQINKNLQNYLKKLHFL